jgi:hypothetical protein
MLRRQSKPLTVAEEDPVMSLQAPSRNKLAVPQNGNLWKFVELIKCI